MDIEAAAEAGDVVMMLVPDELAAKIYNEQIAKAYERGRCTCICTRL